MDINQLKAEAGKDARADHVSNDNGSGNLGWIVRQYWALVSGFRDRRTSPYGAWPHQRCAPLSCWVHLTVASGQVVEKSASAYR